MKLKKQEVKAPVRNKYTAQFKEQVLERADRDGIPKVALFFHYSIHFPRHIKIVQMS